MNDDEQIEVRTVKLEDGTEAVVAPDKGFVERLAAAGVIVNLRQRRVDGGTVTEFDWADDLPKPGSASS